MYRIEEPAQSSFRTKGSKFLGWLLPARTRDAFEQELEVIRAAHPTATHHCWAWRLDSGDPEHPEEMAQDDGEPSGTAGIPILNQLRSAELFLTGSVVVRYYGGTPLGKAGLIEAYGQTTELAIQAASLLPVSPVWAVQIEYDYSDQSLIDQWTHTFRLTEADRHYAATVTRTLLCPQPDAARLREQLQSNEWRLHKVRDRGMRWI